MNFLLNARQSPLLADFWLDAICILLIRNSALKIYKNSYMLLSLHLIHWMAWNIKQFIEILSFLCFRHLLLRQRYEPWNFEYLALYIAGSWLRQHTHTYDCSIQEMLKLFVQDSPWYFLFGHPIISGLPQIVNTCIVG